MTEEPEIVDDIFSGFAEPTLLEKTKYRLSYYLSETKYFFRKIYQRFTYGFPLEQSWDFCSYHSQWVLPRLKHLRANLHGHPNGLVEGEWEAILDKMIWSFENWENDPDPIYPENYDHRMIRTEIEGGASFSKIDHRPIDFSPLYDHRKKAKEGFNLFAEYYMNLWD